MTRRELANCLNLNENTLIRNFPRTKQRLEEKGIIIGCVGRGKTAEYYLDETMDGAIEVYRNNKKIKITYETIAQQQEKKKSAPPPPNKKDIDKYNIKVNNSIPIWIVAKILDASKEEITEEALDILETTEIY